MWSWKECFDKLFGLGLRSPSRDMFEQQLMGSKLSSREARYGSSCSFSFAEWDMQAWGRAESLPLEEVKVMPLRDPLLCPLLFNPAVCYKLEGLRGLYVAPIFKLSLECLTLIWSPCNMQRNPRTPGNWCEYVYPECSLLWLKIDLGPSWEFLYCKNIAEIWVSAMGNMSRSTLSNKHNCLYKTRTLDIKKNNKYSSHWCYKHKQELNNFPRCLQCLRLFIFMFRHQQWQVHGLMVWPVMFYIS